MKNIFVFSFVCLCAVMAVADSAYKDVPVQMSTDFEPILSKYSNRSIKKLPYFNEQLKEGNEDSYYVTTRLYEDDAFEQIFVEVSKFVDGEYLGFIASEPVGRISFSSGDAIDVAEADVIDWLIVKADGSEEGNFLGKIVDLYRVGTAAFVYEMVVSQGKYSEFNVVSVKNVQTKQEIFSVVPGEIIRKIERHVKNVHKNDVPEGDKNMFSYALVDFPDWVIREN